VARRDEARTAKVITSTADQHGAVANLSRTLLGPTNVFEKNLMNLAEHLKGERLALSKVFEPMFESQYVIPHLSCVRRVGQLSGVNFKKK
jgi:hypothetical protein